MHVCDRQSCNNFAALHIGVKLPATVEWFPTSHMPFYSGLVICAACRNKVPVAEVLSPAMQMSILDLMDQSGLPIPPDWRQAKLIFASIGAPEVPRELLQQLGYAPQNGERVQ